MQSATHIRLELQEVHDESIDPELEEIAEQRFDSDDARRDADDARRVSADGSPPFDLRITRPIAVRIEKLRRLAGQAVPSSAEAHPPLVHFLLIHGITAFHEPGRRPRGIWGVGYEAAIDGDRVDTIAMEPGTNWATVARARQQVSVGLSGGGKFGMPGAIAKGHPIDFGVPYLDVRSSTDQTFELAIDFAFTILKVQAGAFGAGGAKWNLYRVDDRLDAQQILLQTIQAPSDLSAVKIRTSAWVRSSGFLGLRSRLWKSSSSTDFDVALG